MSIIDCENRVVLTDKLQSLRYGNPKRHHLHSAATAECRRIASQLRSLFDLLVLDEDQESMQLLMFCDKIRIMKHFLHRVR